MDLAASGVAEAHRAARLFVAEGVHIDVVHTSALLRARRTALVVAGGLGLSASEIRESWRLNERHAGALEGLTREEMISRYGRVAVRAWKRSVSVRPPPMSEDDVRHPCRDARYRDVPRRFLPSGEASSDVLARVLPYWDSAVVGDLQAGLGVLVVTHEQVIRALAGHLQRDRDLAVPVEPVGNGVPWVLWLSPEGGHIVHGRMLRNPPAAQDE